MSDTDLVPIESAPVTIQTLKSLLGQPTVPARYESVADMVATVIQGRELGLAPMTALNNLFMVNGQVAMTGKCMLALVNRAGHRIDVRISSEGAEAVAHRRDPLTQELSEVGTFTFTEEDAERAGLLEKDNYQSYPQMMYGWRAVSMAVRFAFADVTIGVLLPEEVNIEAEVEPIPDAVLVTDLDDDSEAVDLSEAAERLGMATADDE